MSRLLVHIASGPENPTRAALALLVARTALDGGHAVDLFLAGDGVGILRPATLDAGAGIGTGSFRDHVAELVAVGARSTRPANPARPGALGPTISVTSRFKFLRPTSWSASRSRPIEP